MTWPNFFLPGCPPDTAVADTLTVYRLVENVPPNADDFKSHKEKKPGKNYRECSAFAVSVFTDIRDAKNARETISKRRENVDMKIAKGTTNPNKGVVLQSHNSSHVDYWIHEGFIVHGEFVVIAEGAERS